jgi:hypothetical protein
MDSLQQKFGGETDLPPVKQKITPIALLSVMSVFGIGLATYLLWPSPAPAPIVEEQVELPLSATEVETYRASLPKTTAVEATSSSPLIATTPKTSVTFVADDTDVPVTEPTPAFVPPVAATPVSVTTVGDNSGMATTPENSTPNAMTMYVEGDITADGVVITQPDAANLKPIEATVVVAAVDATTNQIVVTSGGEVFTLTLDGGRLQTKEGKLLSISSLAENDILTISGDQRADAPVIQARIASLIGVQEIIDEL